VVCVCLHVLFGCVCYVRQSTCVRVAHVCMTLASSVLNARVDDITYTYRWLECHAQIHVWERWGAGVETQKNVRGEIGGRGRVPFHENYALSLSTIYDGA